MDDLTRADIIQKSWDMHRAVEERLLGHPATRDSHDWLDKQRLLLADMALHLLQTALKPGAIELDKLQNNLHAILTIADPFLPHAGLEHATAHIHGRK